MKKKYRIILYTSIFLLCVVASIILVVKKSNSVYEEESKPKVVKHKSMLSMNLEQTAGSGDYKTVTQSSWPTEGYKFNAELSKCENGSTLSWDDTKKAVIMQGNVSDKCYVYFDIWIPSIADYCTSGTDLATCVKNFGDQGPSVSNIYIHNSSLTNGAGDNSYRYAGANPNNFVCFGSDASPCPIDNLYRIIGVFGENYHGANGKQLVKLIKYDYMTTDELGTDGDYSQTYKEWGMDSTYKGTYGDGERIGVYYWNYKATGSATNTWSTSLLNKTNLNTNFINNIGTTWANKIATVTWKVGGNTWANIGTKTSSVAYTNEITNPVTTNTTDNATTYSAKIGLMYVSDYGFAASPDAWTLTMSSYNNTTATNNNWMYMGLYEWTISRDADYSYGAFGVSYVGYVGGYDVFSYRGVRASFNLESSVSYVSGSGSMSDPIVIN
ncbi:unknown [Firmicutes bacterium CAG:460]|nr:unknown [Firmicutes bacterium CAG:460]